MGPLSGKVTGTGSFTGKKHKGHMCGKALLFSTHRYSFDTRICLRVHISPFSWINQNCIFKGQNPIKLSTWMIKELSVIPNYLRLFTFVAGTYIFTENQIDGKICIGLGVKSIIIIIHISATFTSKFSFPSHLHNVKKKSACNIFIGFACFG